MNFISKLTGPCSVPFIPQVGLLLSFTLHAENGGVEFDHKSHLVSRSYALLTSPHTLTLVG